MSVLPASQSSAFFRVPGEQLTLRASLLCSRMHNQLSELRKIETARHELSADQKAGRAFETKLRGFANGPRENGSDFPGVRVAIAAQLSHVDACGHQGRLPKPQRSRGVASGVLISASLACRYLPCQFAASADCAAYSETSPKTGHSL